MAETRIDDSTAQVSRRTVTRAVAWSVPAIAVAAVVPAVAASTQGGAGAVGTVSVVGACAGATNTGRITVSVGPFPATAQILITLTHTGGGSFTATPQFAHEGTGNGPYTVTSPGGGSIYVGVIDIVFTLGTNQQGTVTATVTPIAPYSFSGASDTTGYVTKRRDGNSSNYNQCSAG